MPNTDSLVPEALADADLSTILDAWQTATDRLQRTHEALRAEVIRLTDELHEKNRQLERRNRLADLGQMAAHVAHEVRNALVPVRLYLSLLERDLAGQGEFAALLDPLGSGFASMERLVTDLLQFAGDCRPDVAVVDIADFADELHELLRPQLDAADVDWQQRIPAGFSVVADREMLRRAFMNLAGNALDAVGDQGRLVFTAVLGSEGAELGLADNGPGVPPADRARLFDPFFTTKRGGTGLGLAMVERIASAHGGSARVETVAPHGARFVLTIPPSHAAGSEKERHAAA